VAIKLAFKGGGRDPFLQKYQTSLKNRAWDTVSEATRKKEAFSTAKAGVTGIIRAKENEMRNTDKTIQQAFADINALMQKAKDMVLYTLHFTNSLFHCTTCSFDYSTCYEEE
jgi:ESCRT-II complex subunit VPS36